MEPLPLDTNGFDGTYKLVGGQPSLDLVNTLAWAGTEREHDWLDTPGNVTLWALHNGLIDAVTRTALDTATGERPAARRAELAAVHDLRAMIADVLGPLASGDGPPPTAVARLEDELYRAGRRRRIDPETLRWTWQTPTTLEDVMAPVVWNAADVLTEVDVRRLGHCPTCRWLFHDTTRNRSRRWCDMQDCGSRDKALRYYHRSRSTAETSPGTVQGR